MNRLESYLLQHFEANIQEVKDFEKVLLALAVVSLIVINEIVRLV